MSSRWVILLLCAATVSRAQEAPKEPPAPATKAPAVPAQAGTPAAKAAAVATQPGKAAAQLPARRGAIAPHTNVETTEGLEKRSQARSKPAAEAANPAPHPQE